MTWLDELFTSRKQMHLTALAAPMYGSVASLWNYVANGVIELVSECRIGDNRHSYFIRPAKYVSGSDLRTEKIPSDCQFDAPVEFTNNIHKIVISAPFGQGAGVYQVNISIDDHTASFVPLISEAMDKGASGTLSGLANNGWHFTLWLSPAQAFETGCRLAAASSRTVPAATHKMILAEHSASSEPWTSSSSK